MFSTWSIVIGKTNDRRPITKPPATTITHLLFCTSILSCMFLFFAKILKQDDIYVLKLFCFIRNGGFSIYITTPVNTSSNIVLNEYSIIVFAGLI